MPSSFSHSRSTSSYDLRSPGLSPVEASCGSGLLRKTWLKRDSSYRITPFRARGRGITSETLEIDAWCEPYLVYTALLGLVSWWLGGCCSVSYSAR